MHSCVSARKFNREEKTEEVLFMLIGKINLVWAVQDMLGDKFNLRSQKSQELSGSLLSAVSDTKNKLEEQRTQLSSAKIKILLLPALLRN